MTSPEETKGTEGERSNQAEVLQAVIHRFLGMALETEVVNPAEIILCRLGEPFYPFAKLKDLKPLLEEDLSKGKETEAARTHIEFGGTAGTITLWPVKHLDYFRTPGGVKTPLGSVRYSEVRQDYQTTYEENPLEFRISFMATASRYQRLVEEIVAKVVLGDNLYYYGNEGSFAKDAYLHHFGKVPIFYHCLPPEGEKKAPVIWLPFDLKRLSTVEITFVERKQETK